MPGTAYDRVDGTIWFSNLKLALTDPRFTTAELSVSKTYSYLQNSSQDNKCEALYRGPCIPFISVYRKRPSVKPGFELLKLVQVH